MVVPPVSSKDSWYLFRWHFLGILLVLGIMYDGCTSPNFQYGAQHAMQKLIQLGLLGFVKMRSKYNEKEGQQDKNQEHLYKILQNCQMKDFGVKMDKPSMFNYLWNYMR